MSARPRVLVVGAGPGGVAAAARLAERGGGAVDVLLVTRGGWARHLPSTLGVLLGELAADSATVVAAPAGVDVRAGEVQSVDGSGAVVDDERVDAAAVIAAPGLELDVCAVPDWPRVLVAWDLETAAAAAAALSAAPGGRMLVAACSLPYRCPPAPFSLAFELGFRHTRSGRFAKLCVATPEAFPLAGVGGEAPAFLLEACLGARVEVERGFEVDLAASEDGILRSRDGRERRYRTLVAIPPHRRPAMLAGLPGTDPLVEVGERGATPVPGLYVVGDCAASGLPRAGGAAEATARTAADAVLAGLGLAAPQPPHAVEATCFVSHGGGSTARLRVRYPDGTPGGEPRVEIDGPALELAAAAEGERRRFLRLAGGGSFRI